MLTWSYKGWWIHDHFNDGVTQVQSPTYQVFRVVSVHAAKLFITRRSNA